MTEYDYQRLPYLVRFEDHSVIKETYARQLNQITLEGHLLRPNDRPSKTLLVFMHPSGLMHYLPMPIAMAKAGHHVMTAGSRYPKNDSALIMEKVALDLQAHIRHAKGEFGYEKIILAGGRGAAPCPCSINRKPRTHRLPRRREATRLIWLPPGWNRWTACCN